MGNIALTFTTRLQTSSGRAIVTNPALANAIGNPAMAHIQNGEEFNIDGLEDGMLDLGLPVSVQTFLWRQIAPFVRPKLGKLHEASCMVSGADPSAESFRALELLFATITSINN